MKRMLLVLAVVMGMTASVSAEQIYFRGTASASGTGSQFYNGRLWTMLVTYTPAVSGPATVTAATLFWYSNDATDHRNESFNLVAPANVANNEIAVNQNAGSNNDGLTIQTEFGPSELGRGTTAAFMDNLVVTGQKDVANTNGTVANITALGAIGNSVAGTFRVAPRPGTAGGSLQVNLTGFVAVPEPGSIALLSGLGLVVGRRLLKRRAKKQEAAV